MMDGKTHMKIVMLGEGRVGKTSLTLKYVDNKFDENQESTINASYLEKEVRVGGEKKQLAIWDTAGQEKFHALAPIYYRDAEGAVLVYDITFRESFDKVTKWMSELRNHADENIVIAIAGNKSDKESSRQIDNDEADRYAKENGVKHFQTSAKTGKGMTEMFQYLSEEIFKKGAGSAKDGKKKLLLVDDDNKRGGKKGKKDSSCC